jgi:outer membrane protein assembly factor BamD (BamD/ComL family)
VVTQLGGGDQTRPSEALLLSQAKRLAASDPEAALRRVESLAFHYPEGAFVQERELLEIQLHERLGHQQTAEQLIQRFRARHPASVYRRALAP